MIARDPALLAWLVVAAAFYPALGQTNTSPVLSPEDHAAIAKMEASSDSTTPASHALIAPLRARWRAEHDPAKRRDLASQLVEAIIHDYGEQPVEIADEVARDGLPQKVLAAPPARTIPLEPIFVLPGAHRDEMENPGMPVFRRIAADRFEAWVPKEGWLFNAKGKLLTDAHVPRRDGTGRDWFGAFLPDGRWITTDLWSNDRQITLFDPQGDPRWELPGQDVVSAIDGLNKPAYESDRPQPSCAWARADLTGRRWLVCMGRDWTRGLAFVTPGRKITPLRDDAKMWQLVYPRSMGYRGMFISYFIDSDDGRRTLLREEAGHGVGVGWPEYELATGRVAGSDPTLNFDVVIHDGSDGFGFWPKSHDVYIHSGYGQEPDRVWFFDAAGRYEGEVAGHPLDDAANGRDLLMQTDDGIIATLHRNAQGPEVASTRRFTWPDGSPAVAIAFYDDLRLGFFLRGAGTAGSSNEARQARSSADIVLARW